MAMKKKATGAGGELTFDMTPMIDIVFQLLIFFMVMVTFIEAQTQADLILPVADRAVPPAENLEKELFVFNVVNLNKRMSDGSLVFPTGTPPYFVSGRAVNTAALRRELDLAAERNRARTGGNQVESAVIIRGDRDVAWIYVMAAMKQAQEAGFTKVYLKALVAEEEPRRKPNP